MIVNVEHGHFVVDYSEPPAENGWRRNGSIDVVCATAERAIEVFRTVHPNATIHVVRRVGGRARILVDLPDSPQAQQVRAWLAGQIHAEHDTFAMGREFAEAIVGPPEPAWPMP